ncbi:extracellular solute-binding protein [Arthrobacter sp. SLBN-53]|uniref:extracellular solute-binding protein n=1 Tax=Arthrobacter sp. SLBN-53 TaxID=2768412 RepID=UPI001152B503|nr:extracellular solute-binding protein [Arthrobacter sp. SLBN-53]TQK30619.1 putative spermidine/putrescine transport system substrate-binding protein [Arthrobacter sp. SLBN-53]
MSRVRFGKVAAAITVALCSAAAVACGNSQAPANNSADFDSSVFPESTFKGLSGSLTWYDSSGGLTAEAKNETVWKDFTALTGLPSQAEYTDGTSTKFRAAAESGNVPWNLIEFGTGGEYFQAAEAGLLEEVDTGVVPVDKLAAASVDTFGIKVEDNASVLVWNTGAFGDKKPTSSADLFNTKDFPGKRCLYKYPVSGGTLEVALLADGVAPADMYPLDVDRALAKLGTIKNDIVWWESGSTVLQLLNNGECAMGMVWTGRVYDAIVKQKLPLEFTWDGALTTAAYFAVPKGAPNSKIGQAALAMWILDREGQIGFVDRTTYTTAIKDLGPDDYDPAVQPYVVSEQNAARTVAEDAQYYATNIDAVSAALATFQAQ